jgi:hypothetical protein
LFSCKNLSSVGEGCKETALLPSHNGEECCPSLSDTHRRLRFLSYFLFVGTRRDFPEFV